MKKKSVPFKNSVARFVPVLAALTVFSTSVAALAGSPHKDEKQPQSKVLSKKDKKLKKPFKKRPPTLSLDEALESESHVSETHQSTEALTPTTPERDSRESETTGLTPVLKKHQLESPDFIDRHRLNGTPSPHHYLISPVRVSTPPKKAYKAYIDGLMELDSEIPQYFLMLAGIELGNHQRFFAEKNIFDENSYIQHLSIDPAHNEVDATAEQIDSATDETESRNNAQALEEQGAEAKTKKSRGKKKAKKAKKLDPLDPKTLYSQKYSRVKGILEAFAGLEAIIQGKIQGPLVRGPKEIEFFAAGVPIDVKTSRYDKHLRTLVQDKEPGVFSIDPEVAKHMTDLSNAIIKQLKKPHINSVTKKLETVKVILDTSYLSERKSQILRTTLTAALAQAAQAEPDPEKRRAFSYENIFSVNLSTHLSFKFPPSRSHGIEEEPADRGRPGQRALQFEDDAPEEEAPIQDHRSRKLVKKRLQTEFGED